MFNLFKRSKKMEEKDIERAVELLKAINEKIEEKDDE